MPALCHGSSASHQCEEKKRRGIGHDSSTLNAPNAPVLIPYDASRKRRGKRASAAGAARVGQLIIANRACSGSNVAFIGCEILKPPVRTAAGSLRKGAIILSATDHVCRGRPDIKEFFYIVERRGWSGMTNSKWSDVKFVEDTDTWEATAELYPGAVLLDLGAADFVSLDHFTPLAVPKTYTAIHIAQWSGFKRHGLFLAAAALLREHRFLKFGHFASGGTDKELELREKVVAVAKRNTPNVDLPYSGLTTNEGLPMGATELNRIINGSQMGVIASRDEGINKFKMECMAADIPVLVPSDACTPLRKHITPETGLLFEPTPRGLADAMLRVLERRAEFHARQYVLERTGSSRSSQMLQNALNECCRRDGYAPYFQGIQWDGRRQIWGEATFRAIGEAIKAIAVPGSMGGT